MPAAIAAAEAARRASPQARLRFGLAVGTYRLTAPPVLPASISGTPQAPTVFAPARGAQATISGSHLLVLRWQPYRNGIYVADLVLIAETRTPSLAAKQADWLGIQKEDFVRTATRSPGVVLVVNSASNASSLEAHERYVRAKARVVYECCVTMNCVNHLIADHELVESLAEIVEDELDARSRK